VISFGDGFCGALGKVAKDDGFFGWEKIDLCVSESFADVDVCPDGGAFFPARFHARRSDLNGEWLFRLSHMFLDSSDI